MEFTLLGDTSTSAKLGKGSYSVSRMPNITTRFARGMKSLNGVRGKLRRRTSAGVDEISFFSLEVSLSAASMAFWPSLSLSSVG